jgi:4-hydroxybenzoate polyprenyltransferase
MGALVMRGAGCTINDIVDRNIDARVARTRDRPIPSGAVSVRQAIAFALILSMIGLMVLIQFNSFTIIVCLLSVALIIVYPFAKRYTHWPQAVLGLTFNWGVLVGWAAVQGQLDAPAFLLYGAAVLWTIAYDTIYAHQDKDDDRLIGVKSTALLFGDRTYRWLVLFFGGTLVLAGISGWWAHMGWPFFAFIALVACHFAWQLSALDLEDPKSCLSVFKSNRAAGLLMFAGIVLGSAYSPLGTG